MSCCGRATERPTGADGFGMLDLGEKGERLRQVMVLGTIPMVLVAGPLIGFFIGDYLDRRFGTSPWAMLVFLVLGGVASVRQTIRLLARASEEKSDGAKPKKNGQ